LDTFVDLLLHRAEGEPDAVAYRFFQGVDFASESLTCRELAHKARALAALLQRTQEPGSRLLMVCKSQKNFTLAFFASLMAGMIAVPTALPRRRAFVERLRLLADDAGASALIFDSDEVRACNVGADGLGMQGIDLRDELERADQAELAQHWKRPELRDASIALLQYTSGSTGAPKGVAVSHGNLMCNSAVIREAMEITSDSKVLTALPMFHDMGLVGGLLQPMFSGCTGHFLSPSECAQYPERWLQIVSRFGITVSGGPNFMYDLAARGIAPAELEGIDLSRWAVAFCGAEPIRPATIELFIKHFAPHGFRAETFYPCYGMAEATLFITGKRAGKKAAVCDLQGVNVVSCGVPRGDTTVRIVDPETRAALSDGSVGEIWTGGRSVARGYWRRPELSERVFRAMIAGGGEETYLRTGDLGYLKDGELHVTGRLKDLIIMYGKKYAPQDIEEQAETSHPAVHGCGGAAFSVMRDGAEAAVLVIELRREWLRRADELAAVAAAIRLSVQRLCGLALDDVAFIRPGALPRTSSGKVMRSKCRDDYLDESLEPVGRAPRARRDGTSPAALA